ncbi:hypothetical protein JTE90_011323 [Oedothorax gibbosus]|uniref:Proton-coupled folate transporter n=1 Tax=Oedothorax gibbosus TaxID=931172 RepID=A0AAV6VN73_9ARAC|nr:hypothetical protein JTE90_011323 [Oedothorax gibbosus]
MAIKDKIQPNKDQTFKQNTKIDTPLKSGQPSIQYGSGQDDDVPLLGTEPETSKCNRILQYVSTLTIEPVMFFFIFAMVLSMSCQTNMMMDKGCRYHLNYTEEVCRNLSGHPVEKEAVEILANNYSLYSNLMSLIAAFQMIFIAPWSDKYGRKFPLIIAAFGMVLSDIGLMVCSIFFESPLYFIVLAKIPSEIFGGFICALTIVYSHASEVSTEKTRTLKYTSIEIVMGLGMALGGLAGGMMFRYLGYFYIYLLGTIMHLLCLPWIMIFVEETTGLDITPTWGEKLKDFFVVDSLTKGIKATFRRRENNGRVFLLLLFASMCVMILTYESLGSIGFVYVHHIYDWDQGTYSIVNTIFGFTQLVIVGACLPLLIRFFKISDPVLGLMGVASLMGKYLLYAFSKYKVYIYYAGNVVGYLSILISLAIRSRISKISEKDELGRVFAFLSTCEAMFPMFGTILVTKVFNATMDIYPSVSYLMTVGMLVLPLGTFTWVYIHHKREQRTSPISTK